MPRVIVKQDHAVLRRETYDAEGVTIEALIVAQAEAADGNPTELEALLAKRRAIKARIPKRKAT